MRKGVVLIVVSVLAVVGAIYYKTKPPGKEENQSGDRQSITQALTGKEADVVMESSKFVGRSQGKRQWEFTAKRVEKSLDSNVTIFSDIKKGKIFGEGDQVIGFSADKAVYNETAGDLDLTGNINFYKGMIKIFSASKISYKGAEKKLICPDPVRIKIDGVSLAADNLTGDFANQQIILDGNVSLKEGENQEIKCEKVIYSLKEESFEIIGQTEIEIEL